MSTETIAATERIAEFGQAACDTAREFARLKNREEPSCDTHAGTDKEESLAEIRRAIEERYTLPATEGLSRQPQTAV